MADMNDRIRESERPEDNYKGFELAIKNNFLTAVKADTPVFKTDAQNLWDIYINNLPKDAQQHYNCNACKHFFDRYADLAILTDEGTIESAIWSTHNIPEFFMSATNALRQAVKKSKINGVLISDTKTLGIPLTGVWSHISVELPIAKVIKSRTKTSGQLMAEKREEYLMLSRAVNKFGDDVVEKVLTLAESGTLYRGQKVLENAKWFKQLKDDLAKCNNNKIKENLIWYYVATASGNFAHVNSSMIGTLLNDIADGLDTNLVISRFKEKMDPSNYMRSQSAPTANAIAQAEKLIEDLGLADSLQRRYAKLEEIPDEHKLWVNKDIVSGIQTPTSKTKANGVFAGIKAKDKGVATTSDGIDLPVTVMTYDKFVRTVLPGATNLEVKVDDSNHLMALVTAAVEGSENILQWNNPFSWYYHGGIDAEMKKRIEEAGGRYENNEIRCSLMWNSYSDLDIHCRTPRGEHIYFSDKVASCGGNLDIDMNAGSGKTLKPVENIRWARKSVRGKDINSAPEGKYKFYVHNYSDRNHKDNPYTVELEVNGTIYTMSGLATGTGYQETAFEFEYRNGEIYNLTGAQSSTTVNEDWNISNEFVKVKAIVESPNLWGDTKVTHVGSHTFFILDGIKDTSEGKGRGFFNETLKSELYEIRKTLEAYTAQTPIEGIEEATACGVGYSTENNWDLILKVTSGNSSRLIKIDRFD